MPLHDDYSLLGSVIMTKKVWKEKILISSKRAHAKTKSKGPLFYFWSGEKADEFKFVQNIQQEVKKFIDRKIGIDRQEDFVCSINEALDTSSKVVARNLVLKYLDGSEFDVESWVEAIQQTVDNSLKAMVQTAVQAGSEPDKAQVVTKLDSHTHGEQAEYVIQVETDDEKTLTSRLIKDVLAKNRKTKSVEINSGNNDHKFNLVRASNVAIESDANNKIKCSILAVDDNRSEVTVSEFGKSSGIRKYIFNFDHRDILLKAQLYGYLVSVDYRPSYKFRSGERVEVGGKLISIVGLEDEKLI